MNEESDHWRSELEQLRARVDHLTAELYATRRHLADLEHRAASAPAMAKPVPEPIPILVPTVPPPLPEVPSAPPVGLSARTDPPPLVPAPSRVQAADGRWRTWLQRLQLWPPSDDDNAEVRLGAWWATRLGTLFAVIGVVFFGVYLSVNTPPWVKLVEVLALAGGLLGLGGWLERRVPRFGQVLFAGGLAVGYFAALAAYTVPALKVIENVASAALAQLVAAAAVGVVAWWRRSPVEATMAALLGFVAAGFSLFGGLQLFAVAAAAGLAATGVLWNRRLDWDGPAVVALVGFWSILAALLVSWERVQVVAPWWAWTCVVLGYAVLFWRDEPNRRRATGNPAAAWFQNVNSAAALACGFAIAWSRMPDRLEYFYFSAAVVLIVAGWRRRRAHGAADSVAAVLLIKACGALALTVISVTDGRTTALALLVQSGVMVLAAARLNARPLLFAATVVWGLSLAFQARVLVIQPPLFLSMPGLAALVYFAGAIVWLGEVTRRESGLAGTSANRLAACVAFFLGVLTAVQLGPEPTLPVKFTVVALVMAGLSAWRREASFWISTALLGLGAHLTLAVALIDGAAQRIEVSAVLSASLLGLVALARLTDRAPMDAERRTRAITWSASAVFVLTANLAAWKLLSPLPAALLGAGVTALLAVRAPDVPRRSWTWLAALNWVLFSAGALSREPGSSSIPMSLAVFGFVGVAGVRIWPRGAAQVDRESPRLWPLRVMVAVSGAHAFHAAFVLEDHSRVVALFVALALMNAVLFTFARLPALLTAAWALWIPAAWSASSTAPGLAWLVSISAWLPVLAWRWAPGAFARIFITEGLRRGVLGHEWIATLVLLATIVQLFDDGARVFGLLLAAIGLGLARRTGALRTTLTSWVAVALATIFSGLIWLDGPPREVNFDFLAAVAASVGLGGFALLVTPSRSRRTVPWLSGGIGLLGVFVLAVGQQGALEPYVTVIWGAASLAWFALGLFGRSQPHRLLGLAGILACLPRVFMVDLHSTLYRIIGFAAIGLVLLWVGFSYHRFRRWIVDPVPADPQPPPSSIPPPDLPVA